MSFQFTFYGHSTFGFQIEGHRLITRPRRLIRMTWKRILFWSLTATATMSGMPPPSPSALERP
jgi:hypothetical protein